ncbi:hypothetical protein FXO38_01163 [Capsicum annuum]|nr:hypothetical protein FXO38_01163 [Capsicum annuum]KAF3684963.1 hypothetical protein FXO37_01094 [Capsicum annuum]
MVQLNLGDTGEVITEPADGLDEIEIKVNRDDSTQEVAKAVCLNALSGCTQGVNTIMVKGSLKNKFLIVMVDSGSTHSFIDAQTVKEIGFKPTFSPPIRVIVADGNYMYCISNCLDITWTMQEPRTLPPIRPRDHAIPLKPGALPAQALLAKRSKCSFGQSRVEYLGHVITMEEVSTDPDKVQAMIDWPTPKTLKALRADEAFKKLKLAMSSTPVLALLDYSQEFIVETDACNTGIGVELIQRGRPIAYFSKVAQKFLKRVHTLHGFPESIVSDKDKIFLDNFWQEFFKLAGTQLKFSTAYHPQNDGQTERVNRCIETYLIYMTFSRPIQWKQWLPLAEFWYNTNYHCSLQCSLFEALYVYSPPHISLVPMLDSIVPAADDITIHRQQFQRFLQDHLLQAQNRMKVYADQNRTKREFMVGDQAFLNLHPYRQTFIALRKNLKLNSKYYGPFTVLAKVGPVAYKLDLPTLSCVHPVFHVSLLKKKVRYRIMVQTNLPFTSSDGQFLVKPLAILQRQLVKKGNGAVVKVLVQWINLFPEDSTWEDCDELLARFPDFVDQP